MKHRKKLLSLLLTVSMAISLVPATVMADSNTGSDVDVTQVVAADPAESRAYPDYYSYADAAAYVAEELVNGSADVYFYIHLDTPIDTSTEDLAKENAGKVFKQIKALIDRNLSERNNADFLQYNIKSFGYGTGNMPSPEVSEILFRCVTYFRTTPEQDQAAEEAMDQVINSFGFTDSTTDYDKFIAIYNYIVKNTDYSHNVPGFSAEDKMEYTAYAAICKHTAVCQGYSLLLYRMLQKVEIESRIISGTGNGEAHAWNVVKINDVWYNVDSTWDSTGTIKLNGGVYYPMSYRLKSDSDFPNHVRDEVYTEQSFTVAHNTSGESYPVKPLFMGHALRIERDLTMRFMVYIPSGIDISNLTIDFAISSGRHENVALKDSGYVTSSTATGTYKYYTVDCPLNALEIADTVTATLTYNGEDIVDVYSLIDYCEYIRARESKYGQLVVNLVDAVQNYGHYLQGSSWTDKNRHAPIDAVPGKEITDTSVDDVKALLSSDEYDFTLPTNTPSLVGMKYSLTLKSSVTINLYYKFSSGSIAGAEKVELDGEDWYLVKLGPISPKYFAVRNPLLGEGSDAGSVSVLSYVKAILNSSSANITSAKRYAMVALYDYYKAMDDIEKSINASNLLN